MANVARNPYMSEEGRDKRAYGECGQKSITEYDHNVIGSNICVLLLKKKS